MAGTSRKQEREQRDDIQQELRENVNDAYAFIEGQKTTQTFASVTFEDLMDQQIERLVGKDTDARPNVLHKVDRIEQKLIKAVEQIKELPNNFFHETHKDENVNTPVLPGDTDEEDDEDALPPGLKALYG